MPSRKQDECLRVRVGLFVSWFLLFLACLRKIRMQAVRACGIWAEGMGDQLIFHQDVSTGRTSLPFCLWQLGEDMTIVAKY